MMKKVLARYSIGWSSRTYSATLECGHVQSLYGPNASKQKTAKCRKCTNLAKTVKEVEV